MMVKVLGEGIDCSICLSNFQIGEEANEMPCKHRFHSICIDRWLRINGSCLICRYKMPVNEQCEKKVEESGEDERDDDSSSDMGEDKVIFISRVIITPENIHQLTIPITRINRHSDDMLMEVRVHRHSDVSEAEAGDGDVSEAVGNGDVSKAENDDVPEAGNGDVSETRNGVEL
ncbi:hypothetical protein KY284_013444 [Solanum tuberosum]|nr:hypothetical protein KY284_013444 [Solanum tuberosum]